MQPTFYVRLIAASGKEWVIRIVARSESQAYRAAVKLANQEAPSDGYRCYGLAY